MKAEIIAVGTELLLGQIVNTNAQYLAQACAGAGIDVYYQTVVGDNAGRIRDAFRLAASRADAVICTGGLGPTQDDLTKDVLSAYTGMPLVMHKPSLDKIEESFRRRGAPMVESNARQALMLEGGYALPNDTGMAAGVALKHENSFFVLLPGPPKEMKPMFDRYAKAWLLAQVPGHQPLHSRMLKFAGIGESSLEHALLDLITNQGDPSIAPYAKEGEVTIRVTTRAGSADEAESKLAPVVSEIRSRVGDHLFAEEDIPIEEALVRTLTGMGRTLFAAESCTGGLLGDMITSVPGSSSAFLGSAVCYSNGMKRSLLGVPAELLEGSGAPGAISREMAESMAQQALERSGADYAVAVTGNAGPGAQEDKPVGLVWVALAAKGREVVSASLQAGGSREIIKLRAAKHALYLLWRTLRLESAPE